MLHRALRPRLARRAAALERVPDADLPGLYAGAAAFVFAALHEGFGIPPLEAMRLGVPVLYARSGAMSEVLGDAPLWFNPRNGVDMRDALKWFAQMGAGERAAMIRAGHEQAARYSWRRNALALAEVQRREADALIEARALVPVTQS